jgi:hypothetical protein
MAEAQGRLPSKGVRTAPPQGRASPTLSHRARVKCRFARPAAGPELPYGTVAAAAPGTPLIAPLRT